MVNNKELVKCTENIWNKIILFSKLELPIFGMENEKLMRAIHLKNCNYNCKNCVCDEYENSRYFRKIVQLKTLLLVTESNSLYFYLLQ